MGACETINCGRGAPLSQFNVRVAKTFNLYGTMRLEAFGEVFNMFNSLNPFLGTSIPAAGRLFTGTAANPVPNAVFMKPTAYAGDSGQQEQRLGQIGFRFTF
jgi:hypothetical protein